MVRVRQDVSSLEKHLDVDLEHHEGHGSSIAWGAANPKARCLEQSKKTRSWLEINSPTRDQALPDGPEVARVLNVSRDHRGSFDTGKLEGG
jgi:hypothetical protein